MKNIFLLLVLMSGSGVICLAQSFDRSVLSSDGASGTSGNITLDWTLGELATATLQTPAGMLSQGYHQPVLTVSKVPVRNLLKDFYTVQVMPNPVTSLLRIKITTQSDKGITIDLLDLNGKIVKKETLIPPFNVLELKMDTYPSGLYLIRVTAEDSEFVEMFKVNKID
jgi:hypothetical protein